MKSIKIIFGLSLISTLLLISSCKKGNNTNNATLDSKIKQFNDDAGSYKSELDQADNDINSVMDNTSMGKKGGGWQGSPLCGVTIDSVQIKNKILFLNFDGVTPCFSPSRTRSGQIKVQLTKGNHWGDAGAEITETFINFKVTRLYDNKSIELNGVKKYTDVSGIDWISFVLGSKTLIYKELALGIAVKFDNNLNATWNSARNIEWKYIGKNVNPSIPYDHIQFTGHGDTAVQGFTNVDSWGINRYGSAFTTYYNQSLVSNSYCGFGRFNSGEFVHHVDSANFIFTLGLDQNGNPTPYVCAYGFKVSWNTKGGSGSVILSY